jgi:transposase-like protein
MIGGQDIILEIDGSKIGKVKYHRGHKVDGVWVFGIVERTKERKIVLVPVLDRTKETLISILKTYADPRSNIYSDQFKSYVILKDELGQVDYLPTKINR